MDKEIVRVIDGGPSIIIRERRSIPVFTFQAWVGTGAGSEAAKESGVSHFIEHMVFKPSKGGDSLPQIIEGMGGEVNAFTGYDYTCYHFNARSEGGLLEKLSWKLLDAVFFPDFNREFEEERKVILEEVGMYEDSNSSVLFRNMRELVFKDQPYEREILGSRKTLAVMKPATLSSYHRRFYKPSNMTVVIVGDLDSGETLSHLESYFRKFARKLPRGSAPEAATAKAPRYGHGFRRVGKEISEIHYALGYPACSNTDPLAAVLDVAALAIGQGESSRLNIRLVREEKVALGAGCYTSFLKTGGQFVFSVQPTEGAEMKAAAVLKDELDRIVAGGFSDEEIEKAKANIESSFALSRETCEGLAMRTGTIFSRNNWFEAERRYLDQLRNVTREDVDSALRAIFSSKPSEVWLGNKKKIAAMKPGSGVPGKPAKQKIIARSGPASGVRLLKLDNGVRVLFKPDKRIPLVVVKFAAMGGTGSEQNDEKGYSRFHSIIQTKGTFQRPPEALSKEIELMAGSLSPFYGRNTWGFSMDFLSNRVQQGFDIFSDLLMNPSFREDEMQLLSMLTSEDIKVEEDHPQALSMKLFMKTIFGDHPYGHSVQGDLESLAAINRNRLLAFRNAIIDPSKVVVSVVGDLSESALLGHVEKALLSIRAVAPRNLVPDEPVFQDKAVEVSRKSEKAQVSMVIGYPGRRVGDEGRNIQLVLSSILSAQSGPLFTEIRDRKGLAYSVHPVSFEGLKRGFFAVAIGTSPEKQELARNSVIGVLHDLAGRKPSRQLLDTARKGLVGGFLGDIQRYGYVANSLALDELLGLGFEDMNRFIDDIGSVTGENVMQLAGELFSAPPVTVRVGPAG